MKDYGVVPNTEEIKAFLEDVGLNTASVAAVAKVDGSTARRWLMDENNKSFTPMPWSVWILLNLMFNINKTKDADDFIKSIKNWRRAIPKKPQKRKLSIGDKIKELEERLKKEKKAALL